MRFLLHKLDMWYGRRVCCASVSKKYFYLRPRDIFEIHDPDDDFVIEVISFACISAPYLYIYLSPSCIFSGRPVGLIADERLRVQNVWKGKESGERRKRNPKSKYSESKLHCKFI